MADWSGSHLRLSPVDSASCWLTRLSLDMAVLNTLTSAVSARTSAWSQLYKNRSSRKIDSQRPTIFKRIWFPKDLFSYWESVSRKTYFYTNRPGSTAALLPLSPPLSPSAPELLTLAMLTDRLLAFPIIVADRPKGDSFGWCLANIY